MSEYNENALITPSLVMALDHLCVQGIYNTAFTLARKSISVIVCLVMLFHVMPCRAVLTHFAEVS